MQQQFLKVKKMNQKRKNNISNYILETHGYSVEIWMDKLIKKYPLEYLNKNSIKTTIYSSVPIKKILVFLLINESDIFEKFPYSKQKMVLDNINEERYRELSIESKDAVVRIRTKNV